MKKLMHNCRFAIRYTIRAPLRTALLAGFALFNVLALAYLLHTIDTSEERIDHLFLTTYVHGAVVRTETFLINTKYTDPLISRWMVNQLHASGFLYDIYLEKIITNMTLLPNLPIDDIDPDMREIIDYFGANRTLVVNDIHRFVDENRPRMLEAVVAGLPPFGGELVFTFAYGYDESNLAYGGHSGDEGHIIPILAHEVLLRRLGLYVGDYAYVVVGHLRSELYFNVHIIGSFMGGHPASLGRFYNPPLILMHHRAYHSVLPSEGYAVVRFTVDPVNNRELDYFRDETARQVRNQSARITPFSPPLSLYLNDNELRAVVIPMEQNLNLLRQLLPIAIVLACVLTGGLSLLLMMQRAKFVAVLRVLGTTKTRTRALLVVEQVSVCVIGIAMGIVALHVLNIGISADLILPVALSFAGGVAGSIAGVIVISSRKPLELLQVRE